MEQVFLAVIHIEIIINSLLFLVLVVVFLLVLSEVII